MRLFYSKFVSIFAAIALQTAFAPVFYAQIQGSVNHVTPVPDGAYFLVDGQSYNHAASAVWPAGSKHILYVDTTTQFGVAAKTKLVFRDWEFAGGVLPVNPVAVTADPSIGEYRAVFDVQYGLSVVFFDCPDPTYCPSPGTVYVNGAPLISSGDVYLGAGGTATLQAVPNPGYVFAGWQPGRDQVITGLQNIVTVNGPMFVYPKFQVARKVNLTTVPPGLMVLADRIQVPTPNSLDWGFDTIHSVGPVSPQQDMQGKWWAFSSWSDGGDANHAYHVAASNMPDTLTATYVPAAYVQLRTSPAGLKLKIDGRDNLLQPYFLNWGVGEVHHVEAPAQQTDAQGRIWAFDSWSNGGAAAQDFTVPADADTAGGVLLTANYKQLGKLTVTSSLSGVTVSVDGTACPTPCDIVRSLGTQVHVSAPASLPQGDGSRADFSGFAGSPSGDLTATLGPDAQTATATYRVMNRLVTSSDPAAGASWSVQPSSSDGYYEAQTKVSVSLSPLPGYRFRRWDGDLSGTIPSGVVAMNTPRWVRGLLDPIPYIAPAGLSNAAGTTPQAGVAAGSVASVFGANLASATVVAPDGLLRQTLGGVTVLAGTRLLPIFFVSPTQLNVQLPDDLAAGAQVLTVSGQGQPDVHANFSVVRNAPGLFSQAVLTDDGSGQARAMAIHEDGSPVTGDAPAQTGELLTLYGTGFGPADHPRPEGFAIPQSPAYLLVDTVNVQVGDAVLSAENAFAVPGRIGIDAVQFRLTDGVPTGTNATLKITVNGQDSNTVLLPVQ